MKLFLTCPKGLELLLEEELHQLGITETRQTVAGFSARQSWNRPIGFASGRGWRIGC